VADEPKNPEVTEVDLTDDSYVDDATIQEKRRRISGPGAADFLTAQGGVDRPGIDKGDAALRGDQVVGIDRLVPDLESDDNPSHSERTVYQPAGSRTEKTEKK
jgi:hypothetical protein